MEKELNGIEDIKIVNNRYENYCAPVYNLAIDQVRDGNLNMQSQGYLDLFCYTQKCFYESGWNPITTSHRGKLYYKGVPVNKPFTKIFNLDEHETTSFTIVDQKLSNMDYDILDKANGHLLIISIFLNDKNEQQVVFHTKGTLPGNFDLLDNDIEKFISKHGKALTEFISNLPNCTLMFEAIVEHDKHTLYDKQVELYGDKDSFVLLSASVMVDTDGSWVDFTYEDLVSTAKFLGTPIIKRYNKTDLDSNIYKWFGHKDIEGYVIKFEDGSCVKIKTKEYWLLRSKNDLTGDKIINIFRGGGFGRMEYKLPEEIALPLKELIYDFFTTWYDLVHIDINNENVKNYKSLIGTVGKHQLKKELSLVTDINSKQKTYLYDIIDDKVRDYTKSRLTRKEFVDYYFTNEDMKKDLQTKIENKIEEIFDVYINKG